jgi:hypothetical protein
MKMNRAGVVVPTGRRHATTRSGGTWRSLPREEIAEARAAAVASVADVE